MVFGANGSASRGDDAHDGHDFTYGAAPYRYDQLDSSFAT